MPNYQYKSRDKFGKPISGVMSADTENAVATKLNQLGYIPVSIQEIKSRRFSFPVSFKGFGRVKFSEVNMFTRQLATLQKAGLPILLSLNAIREQTENRFFKEVVTSLYKDIESGLVLSAAMQKFPRVFNALYVNMVASAEASGRLDQALERLAVLGEYDEKVRIRLKNATRYPLIVVVAITIGFLVLTTLVVPRYAQIYSQFSVQLPLPTRILLWINYAVTKFWWLALLVVAGLVVWFQAFVNTKQGRFLWDSFRLKVPVFGPLILKLSISRFTRITGTLMQSGIPILKIMDISSQSTGNDIVSRTIMTIKDNISEGKGMSEPMKISGIFPPVVTQMVSVGEDTGKLDQLLLHVSDYYDEQVDYIINNLTSLIEPILIFVLGLVVLFMALGIFLPMWNLISLFKR